MFGFNQFDPQQLLALQQLEQQQQLINSSPALLNQPPQMMAGMGGLQNLQGMLQQQTLMNQFGAPMGSPGMGSMSSGMKRGGEQENQFEFQPTAPKRRRMELVPVEWTWPTSVEVNLIVANESVGLIIGKAAAGLKEISKDSGAQLIIQEPDMCPAGSKEPTVSLRGSWEAIKKAETKILDKLSQLKPGVSVDDDVSEDKDQVKWLIPESLCGMLIGKGGSTLKNIKDQTGAFIRLANAQELGPGSSERVVYITGTTDQTEQAVEAIKKKVGGRPPGIEGDGGSESQDVMVPTKSVGYILGAGGREMKQLCEASKARVRIASAVELATGSVDHKVTVSGSKEAIKTARSMLKDKVDEWRATQGDDEFGIEDLEDRYTLVKMTIPLVALGHLIGKGGANVREILSKSGASVKVIQDSPPTSLNRLDRPVVITGSIGNIITAQEMILEKLCSASETILNSVKQTTNPIPGQVLPQSQLNPPSSNSPGLLAIPDSQPSTSQQSNDQILAQTIQSLAHDPQALLLALQQLTQQQNQQQQPQSQTQVPNIQQQMQNQALQNFSMLQASGTSQQQRLDQSQPQQLNFQQQNQQAAGGSVTQPLYGQAQNAQNLMYGGSAQNAAMYGFAQQQQPSQQAAQTGAGFGQVAANAQQSFQQQQFAQLQGYGQQQGSSAQNRSVAYNGLGTYPGK